MKEEDRSIDLEEKPLPPLKVPFGAIADRTAKYDLPDENPSVKTERFSSTTTPTRSKKKKTKSVRIKMKAPGSDGSDRDVKLPNREVNVKGWKMDQLEWGYHWKELNKLLASDPVLMILKPELIGSLRGPISAPIATANQLEAIRRLTTILQDDGFAAGAFDAQELLECDSNQVIHASRSLFAKLSPLTGNHDAVDQAIMPIDDIPKGYHTGSSQYASAESEMGSSDSMNIQRMSLGPTGAALLRERMAPIKIEARSTKEATPQDANPIGSGQLQSYFEAAMKKYAQDQQAYARQKASRSNSRSILPTTFPESNYPDVEMESVGSHRSRSENYNIDDPGLEI